MMFGLYFVLQPTPKEIFYHECHLFGARIRTEEEGVTRA